MREEERVSEAGEPLHRRIWNDGTIWSFSNYYIIWNDEITLDLRPINGRYAVRELSLLSWYIFAAEYMHRAWWRRIKLALLKEARKSRSSSVPLGIASRSICMEALSTLAFNSWFHVWNWMFKFFKLFS